MFAPCGSETHSLQKECSARVKSFGGMGVIAH